jgi:hypothetical protein
MLERRAGVLPLTWVMPHQGTTARRALRTRHTSGSNRSAPLRECQGRSGASPHQVAHSPIRRFAHSAIGYWLSDIGYFRSTGRPRCGLGRRFSLGRQ